LAGIKERRIFHYPDGDLDRVKPALPVLESLITGDKGLFQLVAVLLFAFGCQRPATDHTGTAVYDETEPRILRPLQLFDLSAACLLGKHRGGCGQKSRDHE